MALHISERILVVLGSGGVGKSALTQRFVHDIHVTEYDPTIEDWYRKQEVVDKIPVVLNVLDTAGQNDFQTMKDGWIRDGEGFIIVYSLCNRESFYNALAVHEDILRTKNTEKTPIILVGNMCDISDEKREVAYDEAVKVAKRWSCPYLETSSLKAINTDACFHELVRLVRRAEAKAAIAPQPAIATKLGMKNKKQGKKKFCVIV
uniref:Uncharacterized protein n=1 Tax=Lotharella oceanica TaxID=641309 RepID=A0A7S2TU06_9EUKA|mmetsp:Transcript_29923/g.55943  ORF Transcript_29923/g.55943 Transcript_29923/m.55943 type:complete len:205 (+) Transcript_29923:102-716(+)|eukprot:CAMPEP_0170180634 /NCGR_PEP_ID=MMETSP0040_2-20121228/22526_1 /TAXON_ID=641309 /ORGANISM="Lotharella oceanica, Strain CCMP622" /LENGTH=204 /DNA_ID=CAMNT_0010425343 /DNA_START=32 /DNA_END=646 /DNA_ORIENTATION=+